MKSAHSNPPRLLLLLLAFLLVLPAQAAPGESIALPDIGDSGTTVLSGEQERRIGEDVVRNLRRAGHLLDDPLLNDYLDSLGFRLAAGEAATRHDFDFFLVDASDLNAFALPGGFIGVHYGLILAAERESELAAVLAHEIAHITQRHHMRRYTQSQGSSMTITAALIAAVLLGAQSDELGEAAMASIAAGAAQSQVNFTRANEQEADRVGIALLADAGFDPQSMPAFFERMQKNSRLYGPQGPEFLRTHPVTTSRIADSRNRANQLPKRERTDQLQYELMRARLQVITADNPGEARQIFEANLAAGAHVSQDAARYGLALAQMKSGDDDKARETFKELLDGDPQRIAYVIALAEAEMGRGETAEALDVYAQHLALMPGNPALTYYYAEALLQAGESKRARSLLRDFVRKGPRMPEYYRLLARAEADTGQAANAHAAMAEHHYLNGDLRPAIEQLEMALAMKGLDFYTTSRLEARLTAFQAEADALDAQR